MAEVADAHRKPVSEMDDEQLPVPRHRLHGPGHFLGLYGSEHVAATEFVIGAAFVAMGATINDILIGLLIGNTLAVLSFWLITAPIAVKTRLSLYSYLDHNMGEWVPRLYNGANVLIFVAISAAMITVSATAVRVLFDIPPQIYPYPSNVYFALIAASASVIAVLVAYYGWSAPDHGSSFYVSGQRPRGPSCLRVRWEAKAQGARSGLRVREAASRGPSAA